jgi:UDP-N-acetylmuramate dehydrogenase
MTTLFKDFQHIIKENEPLSSRSTMRVGGPAKLAAFPTSAKELAALIAQAKESGIRYIIVGNASNILFSDGGFDGLVIFTTSMRSVVWNGATVTAECGASLTGLAAAATKKGLSGLEFAFGIPGTIGGAVYMNAGAYGSQISAVLTKSTYLRDGEILERSAEEHLFGYRTSIYRSNSDIVLSAEFTLTPGDPEAIAAKAAQNMESRRTKQPLEFPNAGSVFKRPRTDTEVWRLIDLCGLRGHTLGGAQISEKHAGFIVNRGGATATDVRELIALARRSVLHTSGILLIPEIEILSNGK